MPRCRNRAPILALAAALGGCFGPPGPRPVPAPPGEGPARPAVPPPVIPALFASTWIPMAVGERWIYAASWNGIPVGTAVIAAEDVRWIRGRRALHVTCTIQPNAYIDAVYHVRDEIATDVDLETGWPLRFTKHIEEGKRLKDETIEFDPAGKTATYLKCRTGEGETAFAPAAVMTVPEGVQDPLSCLFQARALPLEPGTEAVLAVNTDEKTYGTRLGVLRKGPVFLPNFGDLAGILLEPQLEYEGVLPSKGSLQMWVEAATRVPLKLEVKIRIGTIQADLVRREGAAPFERLPKIPDSERIGRRRDDGR